MTAVWFKTLTNGETFTLLTVDWVTIKMKPANEGLIVSSAKGYEKRKPAVKQMIVARL